MRHVLVAVLAGLGGCSGNGGQGPSLDITDLPATITLDIGETSRIGQTTVRFTAVANDSRCPIDAVCVWAGNAEVALTIGTVGGGQTSELRLNTTLEPRSASAQGLTLALVGLAPAPRSDRPTVNYRLELQVGLAQ